MSGNYSNQQYPIDRGILHDFTCLTALLMTIKAAPTGWLRPCSFRQGFWGEWDKMWKIEEDMEHHQEI